MRRSVFPSPGMRPNWALEISTQWYVCGHLAMSCFVSCVDCHTAYPFRPCGERTAAESNSKNGGPTTTKRFTIPTAATAHHKWCGGSGSFIPQEPKFKTKTTQSSPICRRGAAYRESRVRRTGAGMTTAAHWLQVAESSRRMASTLSQIKKRLDLEALAQALNEVETAPRTITI